MQLQTNEPLYQIMLARYYEAGLGRFLGVDPAQKMGRSLSNPQRWNRYTYTLDNPLKFFDPDGLDLVYADSYAKAAMEETRKISPALNTILKQFESTKSLSLTVRTGRVPDPPGKIALGGTLTTEPTDRSKKPTTFEVVLDKKDINATGWDVRETAIHEVVGHVGAEMDRSQSETDEKTTDELEDEAQGRTAEELERIPANNRPRGKGIGSSSALSTPGQSAKVIKYGVDSSDPLTGK